MADSYESQEALVDFDIVSISYHMQPDVRFSGTEHLPKNMDHGEAWLRADRMYDGHPIRIFVTLNKNRIETMDVYILQDRHYVGDDEEDYAFKDGCGTTVLFSDYLRKKFKKEVPLSEVILIDRAGRQTMGNELFGQIQAHIDTHINKPHIMRFDEFADRREVFGRNDDMDDHTAYTKYLLAIKRDLSGGKVKFIGGIQASQFYTCGSDAKDVIEDLWIDSQKGD